MLLKSFKDDLQRVKSKFILYDQRLKLLKLDRLELRRIHFDAIINRHFLPFEEFYSFPTYTRTRSAEQQILSIEKFRLDVDEFCFCVRSYRICNAIP